MLPVIITIGSHFSETVLQTFVILAFPVCMAMASIPYFRKKLTGGEMCFLGVVLPIVIWIVCVLLNTAVLAVKGRLS